MAPEELEDDALVPGEPEAELEDDVLVPDDPPGGSVPPTQATNTHAIAAIATQVRFIEINFVSGRTLDSRTTHGRQHRTRNPLRDFDHTRTRAWIT
jgi:hypothetical protein